MAAGSSPSPWPTPTALAPEDSGAHHRLVSLLATAGEEKLRDGAQALVHATRACELDGWGDYVHLDMLAAACAEVGRYPEAVYWEEKALELPGAFNKLNEREEANKRLALYRAGRPYHMKSPTGQNR